MVANILVSNDCNYDTASCVPVLYVLDKFYMDKSWASDQTVPICLTIQQEGWDFSLPSNFLIPLAMIQSEGYMTGQTWGSPTPPSHKQA